MTVPGKIINAHPEFGIPDGLKNDQPSRTIVEAHLHLQPLVLGQTEKALVALADKKAAKVVKVIKVVKVVKPHHKKTTTTTYKKPTTTTTIIYKKPTSTKTTTTYKKPTTTTTTTTVKYQKPTTTKTRTTYKPITTTTTTTTSPVPTPTGVFGICEDTLGRCTVQGNVTAQCGSNAHCDAWGLCACESGFRASILSQNYHLGVHTNDNSTSNTTIYVPPGVACSVNCTSETCPDVLNTCDTKPDNCFPGYAALLMKGAMGAYEGLFRNVKVGDVVQIVDKNGQKKFDEVVYVLRAPVQDVVYSILEYVTADGETGEFHLTPFHILSTSTTRSAAPALLQAKEVLPYTYIHHAAHGPVLVTANSQRLIKNAGAYTAIPRTPGALLVVDGIVASPWAVNHDLFEWTFGPVARGLYAILKPMNLHTTVLGSHLFAAINDVIGPSIARAASNVPRAVGALVMPLMKA
ncbi:hypothetical protein HDV00_012448 [Rhizophlyctis rosea]|nr:hypothetical protein HDV00_012448 [Rhizophlyctis rosea]